MVERAEVGAHGLVSCLRRAFSTYGIPEELTSDGGPKFTSTTTRPFLVKWVVHHRLTSATNSHGNCHAEVGVKTVKPMIMDNTNHNGDLDTNKFQRVILQYRNTLDRNTKLSPTANIFGRPIRVYQGNTRKVTY
jgi:hypothetical protein